MARIIGAIASSHTPTIGFALDRDKRDDPAWAPIFEAYEPIQRWLADEKPDVLVLTYNDHVTSFFFDHYSAFALGIGESYPVADEGGGPRALPPVRGHAGLSQHIGASLMADEFDMAFFQGKALDHGVQRVVVTSSIAAIRLATGVEKRALTEEDWTDPDEQGLTPYVRSKTIAA